MAIVRNNDLTSGLSGKFGNMLVFRNLRGKTIISHRPRKPKKQSEQQRENRSKFKDATFFAKTMMRNTEKKAYYMRKAKKLNLPNAYTAAITDYMRKPEVRDIKFKNDTLTGLAVKKNFSIKEVIVTVVNNAGEILERSDAIPVADSSGLWAYRPVTPLPDTGEYKIKVVAIDYVGQTSAVTEFPIGKF